MNREKTTPKPVTETRVVPQKPMLTGGRWTVRGNRPKLVGLNWMAVRGSAMR